MAGITSKLFSWTSDLESWSASSNAVNVSYDAYDGVPSGSMQLTPTNTNVPTNSPSKAPRHVLATVSEGGSNNYQPVYATYSGTWQDFGVPSGSTVTSIYLNSGYNKAGSYSSGQVVGPYCLYQNNNLQATLVPARNPSGAESSWFSIPSQSSQSVSSSAGYSSPSNIIELRIYSTFTATQGPSNHFDETLFTLNYTTPQSSTSNSSASLCITGSAPVPSGQNANSPLVTFGQKGVMNKYSPLYIGDSTQVNKPGGLNLVVMQQTPVYKNNKNSSFYISGSAGNVIRSPSLPIFMNGFVQKVNNKLNLFINNSNTNNYCCLSIAGSLNTTYKYGGVSPLFVNGFSKYTANGPSLFIYQEVTGINSNTNPFRLFIKGPIPYNSLSPKTGPSLFIKAAANYIAGTSFNNSSPMFIFAGNDQCETVNLFLKADPIPIAQLSIPFSVVGSNGTGSYRIMPLFVSGHTMSESMNLVIQGKDSGGQPKIIRFFIKGRNKRKQNYSTMFIKNSALSQQGPTADLFIRGDGQNMGYSPYGDSLGIYIERGPTAGITMYIENKTVSSNSPMYICGVPSATKAASMFVQGLGGKVVNSTPLLTQGDIFKEYNTVSTLVIPNVVGFEPNTAYLYTNGFEY